MSAWDWNAIYLTCFGVGLVLSVASFVLGGGHLHIGHFHMGGHGHGSTAACAKATPGHGASIPPLNGFTLTAFLCWFGGAGYLLHRYSAFAIVPILLLATLSGLAGASLLFWFLAGVLARHERTLEPADTEMTGVIGRLSTALPAGGFGELLYTQNGSRRSATVRSDDAQTIERGAEVVVMRYTGGVAYVRRWEEFEGGLLAVDHRAANGRREEQESTMREP